MLVSLRFASGKVRAMLIKHLNSIDKSSSAELSEAINSMYQWYSNADTCYVLLEDIPSASMVRSDHFDPERLFAKSRWFTRGWTLQELIAPAIVEFYALDWTEIGTKTSLASQVASITGIRLAVLFGEKLSEFTVAERMSWAAKRSTTRVEDLSYCLLGIFQVNMPLLYGEGARAFKRLQEEILKTSEDYTLFAWSESPGLGVDGELLSQTAAAFQDCILSGGHLFTLSDLCLDNGILSLKSISNNDWEINSRWDPPSLTSRGLRITLPLLQDKRDKDRFKACIFCTQQVTKSGRPTTLPVCVDLYVKSADMRIFTRMKPGYDFFPTSYLSLVSWDDISEFTLMTIYVTGATRSPGPKSLSFSKFFEYTTFEINMTSTDDLEDSAVQVLRTRPPKGESRLGGTLYHSTGLFILLFKIESELLLVLAACSSSPPDWKAARGCCKVLAHGTWEDLGNFGNLMDRFDEKIVEGELPDRLVEPLALHQQERQMCIAVRRKPWVGLTGSKSPNPSWIVDISVEKKAVAKKKGAMKRNAKMSGAQRRTAGKRNYFKVKT
jgi:hypothetical protein